MLWESKSRWPALLATAATIASVVAVGWIGASQASEQRRVLGIFDGFIEFLRTSGGALIDQAVANDSTVAGIVTGVALAAIIAWLWRGTQRLPMALLGIAASAVAWGQVSLMQDRVEVGAALYALGMACAFALGLAFQLPRRNESIAHPMSAREHGIVVLLMLVTLLSRTYALTELPNEYETEMMIAMLASSSEAGLREYVPWGITANTNGIVHVYLQLLTFKLFGTSFFSLRFLAVLISVVTVPLFYGLLRRFGGTLAAVIGVLLLLAAPDQLFFGRDENTCIPLVAWAGLVTVVLSMRFVERPGSPRALHLGAWVPFSRYFYSPAIVLPVYPLLLYLHSLLFSRTSPRTLRYFVPAFAVGMTLWVFSLTVAHGVLSGGSWKFIHPANSGGVPVWQGEGGAADRSLAEIVTAQATNLATNLRTAAAGMTFRGSLSTWYTRHDSSAHISNINVAAAGCIALGIAYLLAQIFDLRAFALLLWAGLGILPAVMSLDPAPRRMVMAFPAFYAIAAMFIATAAAILRLHAHGAVTRVFQLVGVAGLAFMLWASAASHFRMPISPSIMARVDKATKPIFLGSDVIFHALPSHWELASRFLQRDTGTEPCVRYIGPEQWLLAALHQPCDFEDVGTRFTVAPEERARLRSQYQPQRISFLIPDEAENAPHLSLLQTMFPRAAATRMQVFEGIDWVWLQVARQDVEHLSQPVVSGARPDGSAEVIAGVKLASDPASAAQPHTQIDGGVLIESDGWYGLKLEPPCAGATLTVDGSEVTTTAPIPLTRGVHQARLTIAEGADCTLPMRLTALRDAEGAAANEAELTWVAPDLLLIQRARARPVGTTAGVREVETGVTWRDPVVDFVLDREGEFAVLEEENENTFRIRRLRPDRSEVGSWRIPGPRPIGLSLAPDYTLFIVYQDRVRVHSLDGALRATWNEPLVRSAMLGHLPDGSIVSALFDRNEVVTLDRKGTLLRSWKSFGEGPQFRAPGAVAIGSSGEVIVVQLDGTALIARTPANTFEPQFERAFRIEYREPAVLPRGWTLDSQGRLIVPEPGFAATLIYDLSGTRIMSRDRRSDLSELAREELVRVVSDRSALYAVGSARRLRRFEEIDG